MQPIKMQRQPVTKMTTNPDIDYEKLLALSEDTLSRPIIPGVTQENLDSASESRDLGSLAAALSGAVRGAGSVRGKLPEDQGFSQIAKDLGDSRTMDMQNRMALRKDQESGMLEAIKNTGIAQQAKAKAERRVKLVSDVDRQIASRRIKQFDPNLPDLPEGMTYGELEENPFLSEVLGINNDTSGMNEYQKAQLALQTMVAQNNADFAGRRLGIQGVTASTAVDAAAAKEADRLAEIERKKALISPTELEAIHKGLKKQGYTNLPKSLTRGDVEKSRLYTSILGGAVSTTNQDANAQSKKDALRVREQGIKDGGKGAEVKQKVLEDIRDIDNVMNSISRIRPLKQKLSTGPLDSRVGKYGGMLKEGMNETFGTKFGVDKERIKFEQEVGINLASYVLAMSGKASTDTERAFLRDNMVDVNDTDTRFEEKLNNLETYMKSKRDIIQKEQGFYGREVPPSPNVQGNDSTPPPKSGGAKKAIKSKQYSAARNQTRISYTDGTVEVLDGKQ